RPQPLLHGIGRDGPAGRGEHVGEPALDPEVAPVVEVPDVAGAVPARRAVAGALGGPQPVVAVLDVRAAHDARADRPGHGDQLLRGYAVLVQRGDPHLGPRDGGPDADAGLVLVGG